MSSTATSDAVTVSPSLVMAALESSTAAVSSPSVKDVPPVMPPGISGGVPPWPFWLSPEGMSGGCWALSVLVSPSGFSGGVPPCWLLPSPSGISGGCWALSVLLPPSGFSGGVPVGCWLSPLPLLSVGAASSVSSPNCMVTVVPSMAVTRPVRVCPA